MKWLSSDVARRILGGLAAQGYGQAVQLVLQLATVPALLGAWGAERYGAWLLLSVLPTYFSLSDLGFAQASANDMTMWAARGDSKRANEVFQSVLLLAGAVAALVVVAALGAALVVPIQRLMHLRSVSAADVRSVTLLLGISAAVSIPSGVLAGALRAEGRFASVQILQTTSRFVEGALIVLVALAARGGLVAAAMAMLGCRLAVIAVQVAMIYRAPGNFRLGVAAARRSELRRLVAPSLSFMAFPLGSALTIQGPLTLLGLYLPAAVPVFATARTLTRIGSNALGMVNHVFLYDYAAAFTRRDARFLRLVAVNGGILLVGLSVYAPAMLLIGPVFYRKWTRGGLELPNNLLVALVLAAASEVVWAYLQTPLIAINAHKRVAAGYIAGGLATFALGALFLGRGLDLVGFVLMQCAMFAALSVLILVSLHELVRNAPRRAGREARAVHVGPL
jgi:hypothetical protein